MFLKFVYSNILDDISKIVHSLSSQGEVPRSVTVQSPEVKNINLLQLGLSRNFREV